MRSMKSLFCLLPLLAMAIPVGAGAAVKCEMKETLDECWDRAGQEKDDRQITELQAEEANDLRDETTSVQAGDTNLTSNTTDFLPLLALSGLLGNAEKSETEGTYTFDLNFLLPGLSKDKNSKLKAIVNSRPTVSEGIKEQIPEADRDDVVKKIEDGLGDLADYSFSYTYSWIDRSHGRGFKNYQDRFAALTTAVYRSFRSSASDQAKQRALVEATDFIGKKGIVIGDRPLTFEEVRSQLPQDQEDDFAAFKEKFEAAADASAAALAVRRQMFADAGLDRFANLLDNQPQLTISASERFRDPVVGGDETSFKVNYEWGMANLNGALKGRCREDLDTSAPETLGSEILDKCLADYTRFVNENQDNLTDGEKLSFSAEYVDMNKEVFDLPQHGLSGLTLNGAKKIVIAAGWSRKFLAAREGEPVRLDFVGRYEDVSDDPQRRDRGVATLTVTRKVAGTEIPFGIVYANHGEFLGEVDKQFSAHLGIKFALGGTPAPQGNGSGSAPQ
jgi:hypothetical protein